MSWWTTAHHYRPDRAPRREAAAMSDMDHYRPESACARCGEDAERCECPHELDVPAHCAHGRTVGEWCQDCDIAGELAMADAMLRAMDRISHF